MSSCPDMRGYAYTDKPDLKPEEGYTPADFAEDIRALLDHLGWQKANIVSHDFGAAWVQQFARTYPDRLDKLVLFNPPYPGIGMRWMELGHVPQVWYQMFHQLPWAEDLVGSSRKATELYVRHFLSHWSHDKDLWTDEEIARVRRSVLAARRHPRRLQLLPRRLPHAAAARRRPEDTRANPHPLGRQRRRPPVRLERQAPRFLPQPDFPQGRKRRPLPDARKAGRS